MKAADPPIVLPLEPLNVHEWRAAADILKRARKLLAEERWYQGTPDTEASACLATALERAWKVGGESLVDFNYARAALSQVLKIPGNPVTASNDPLAVPYWGRNFVYWNDSPGRTKEEVLRCLDHAESFATTACRAAEAANISPQVLEEFDAEMCRNI